MSATASSAADELPDLAALTAATGRLLATARALSDDDIGRPSLLPGWTVGHVLTHIARNADSLLNLATWARTGVRTPQYASAEARDADIEAGSGRPPATQAQDVGDSAVRLQAALETMPAAAWQAVVEWRGGARGPARDIPSARLTEVEVHHADLGLDYGFGDLPEPIRVRLLGNAVKNWPPDFGVTVQAEDVGRSWPDGEPRPVVVRGSSGDLLGWATGRTAGERLRCDTELPAVPAWR